jgi:signal transduction histidine kinase/DNA-binding response OmpR family regulator
MIGAAAGPASHVAVAHEDANRAEVLARVLRTAGHRVTVVVPGRRIAQSLVEAEPDLVIASLTLIDPPMPEIVREVRRALKDDVRILVLYHFDPQDAPSEADDVLRSEPLEEGELVIRAGRLLRDLAERRALHKKTNELQGLYRMSWAFSLAGGAEVLFGHIAKHSAEMLKANRGLVLLYDSERRQMVAQRPGHGLTTEQVDRVRYAVDGEARSRWNFRKNGPLLSNKAQADTRLLPDFVGGLRLQSLVVAPITRGPTILGLLAVADRVGGGQFTDEDLNLLIALAGQSTIAVENLRLHGEIKKANELLQEYDRLKSEFVGIVAHDFRRPLMAIRGFAELVLEEPDLALETRQEFMRTVISETEHLALLANDTLLITQIETGQFSFHFQEMDIGPFVLETVPLGLSDHSVLMDVPPGIPKIWADPNRLHQVLNNLVSNAVKYSPTGGEVIVRCRQRGPDHVVIEVVDHGLGIPQEQIGKLFQKFARVRTNEHMKISGTGLGLYICRLIVEGHGGQVWVESEVGKGSTFGIVLPLDARTAQGAGAAATVASEAVPAPVPGVPAVLLATIRIPAAQIPTPASPAADPEPAARPGAEGPPATKEPDTPRDERRTAAEPSPVDEPEPAD